MKSRLEALPKELIINILLCCDMKSQLRVSASSRFFNDIVNDTKLPFFAQLVHYKECYHNTKAKKILKGFNIEEDLASGVIHAKTLLDLVDKQETEQLKKILAEKHPYMILLLPSYVPSAGPHFKAIKKPYTLYLTEEAAKRNILNHFNLNHYDKVKLDIDQIDFSALYNDGDKVNLQLLLEEKNWMETISVSAQKKTRAFT